MTTKRWLLLALISIQISLQAQSLDNAKQMYYYERYNSANTTLKALVAADAKNAEAQYWLVLTNIMQGNKAAAKATSDASLTANPSSPWSNIAAGHYALAYDDKPAAKIKFETAISFSDKKSMANTIIGIGRAHGSVGISQSEPDYAIEKLNTVLAKDPQNAEALIVLGDCYRRKIDGSNAVSNYMKVAPTAPQNARATYRIGQVYKTQDNCKSLTNYFTEVTTKDASFMPAWRELYDSYGNDESTCFNIAQARTYLDKFVATSDPGFEVDKIKMEFCYYSKDYTCALGLANEIGKKYDENSAIEMLAWKGYISDKLKDSVAALQYLDEYLTKVKDPKTLDPKVYKKTAEVAAKIPGKEAQFINYYNQYISKVDDPKLKAGAYMKLAEYYEKNKDYINAASWYTKVVDIKTDPSTLEVYKAGLMSYNAQNFTESLRMFTLYANKFPDDYRGHLFSARCNVALDSASKQGLAVPSYEKYLAIAEKDLITNKRGLVEAYSYIIAFNLSNKNDKATATAYLEKLKLADATSPAIADFEAAIKGGGRAPAPKPVVNTAPKPAKTTTVKPVTPKPVTPKPAITKPTTPKPTAPKPPKM